MSDTSHSVQLDSNGVVRTRSLYDRPGDDYLSNKGDLWSFSFSSFGFSCVRISDIDRVSIVESANDGWNIETIVTLVSDSSSRLQVLTRDFDVYRWIDGDGAASHRRFDLSFAGNKINYTINACMHAFESPHCFCLYKLYTVNREYFDVKIFSDSMACTKIKRTKFMHDINDNAVQGHLSENDLTRKIIA